MAAMFRHFRHWTTCLRQSASGHRVTRSSNNCKGLGTTCTARSPRRDPSSEDRGDGSGGGRHRRSAHPARRQVFLCTGGRRTPGEAFLSSGHVQRNCHLLGWRVALHCLHVATHAPDRATIQTSHRHRQRCDSRDRRRDRNRSGSECEERNSWDGRHESWWALEASRSFWRAIMKRTADCWKRHRKECGCCRKGTAPDSFRWERTRSRSQREHDGV